MEASRFFLCRGWGSGDSCCAGKCSSR
ncbi:hypothetical protein LEMLEM_LOCUS805 [Lemmus lemmus]